MPCFRHEAYVGAAVESVLAQTFPDWELIAIDDASPDATLRVLRRFGDPRIRILHHEQNAGAHATINEGIGLARGDFVTILNSDDLLAPTRFEGLLALHERTGADVLGTDLELVDREARPMLDPKHYWLAWYAGLKAHLATHGSIRRTLLNGNVFITTSNLLFRRAFFEALGPFEPLRYTHDYEWLLRAVDRGHHVHFEPSQRTLSYRLHGANTILEAPLGPNRETFELLMRYCHLLMREPEAAAHHEYADHVGRIVSLIEHSHLAARGLRPKLRALDERLRTVLRGLVPMRRGH